MGFCNKWICIDGRWRQDSFVIFFVPVRMPLQLNLAHFYANVLIVVESHSSQRRPVSSGIPSDWVDAVKCHGNAAIHSHHQQELSHCSFSFVLSDSLQLHRFLHQLGEEKRHLEFSLIFHFDFKVLVHKERIKQLQKYTQSKWRCSHPYNRFRNCLCQILPVLFSITCPRLYFGPEEFLGWFFFFFLLLKIEFKW